jgi:septum formation protein
MTERITEVTLASASPRRLALLQSIGLRVTVAPTAYDENAVVGETATAAALRHAAGKAQAAKDGGPPLLIAADTIVDVDGEMLGKPRDRAQATAMLRRLAGREHVVHTGFAVVDRARERRCVGVESTIVRFVSLDDAAVERYVATGEPMDKAGAYAIQGFGALLVERIDGDFYTVMGLPLVRVSGALRDLGYGVL